MCTLSDLLRGPKVKVPGERGEPDGPPLPDPGKLTDDQIATLRRAGEVRPTVAGEVLFREGDHGYDFLVILSGRVRVVDHQAGVERELVTGEPGEFVAELNLLTRERLFTTAVVSEPGEILVVPLARLLQVISRDEALGVRILQTALNRRQWLAQVGTGLRIIGARSSAETQQLLEFAARNRLPHIWFEPGVDSAADSVLAHHSLTPEQAPIVVMRGGDVLVQPSNAELARAAGVGAGPAPGLTYDVVIVGAGPAGLAAAVYGASEGLSTAVVDEMAVGGQIATTSKVENYLGFPLGISGEEFAMRAFLQVLRFGASIVLPAAATGLSVDGVIPVVHLDTVQDIATRSVIIATGVSYRRIDAAGLDRFGASVFYTPLAAHGGKLAGEPVVIAGGGNSAGQAAVELADSGSSVAIVIRGTDLDATMSRYLIERIDAQPLISVRTRSTVREVGGSGRLQWVDIEDIDTGGRDRLPAEALFVLIGAQPHTQWLGTTVMRDQNGYVRTGPELGAEARRQQPWTMLDRDPYLLETSVPGIFAVGDARSGSVKRVASAVGEGSMAIRFVSEYLGRRAGFAASARGLTQVHRVSALSAAPAYNSAARQQYHATIER